jgi:hypothetical protein
MSETSGADPRLGADPDSKTKPGHGGPEQVGVVDRSES